MKFHRLVMIRITRARRPAFGLLVSVDRAAGTGVVMRDGVRYRRRLKFIYPATGRRSARVRDGA